MNSGLQAWHQVPLEAEPSCWGLGISILKHKEDWGKDNKTVFVLASHLLFIFFFWGRWRLITTPLVCPIASRGPWLCFQASQSHPEDETIAATGFELAV